jgi:hypothetical protein
MANELKAYCDFKNIDGELRRVEIWGPTSKLPATPVELESAYPVAVINWQRKEDGIYTDPIMFSELSFRFYNVDGDADVIINQIIGGTENEWSIALFNSNPDPKELLWCGTILTDTLTSELGGPSELIEIRAADGFKTLQNYTTHDDVNVMGTNFYKCIRNTIGFTDHIGSAATSVFFGPQFTVPGTINQVFKDVVFEREFDNDYDWLVAVLNDLALYLVHWNGKYYFIPIFYAASGNISGTNYKEDLTVVSSSTLSFSTLTTDINWKGTKRWTRPYKDIILSYKSGSNTFSESSGASYSPSVWQYFENVWNRFITGKPKNDLVLTLDWYAEMLKDSGSTNHFNIFNLYVKYGTKWFRGSDKTWVTSSAIADFNNVTGESGTTIYGQGVLNIPLGTADVSADSLLTVTLEFRQANSGVTIINSTNWGLLFTIQSEIDDIEHETGTNRPQLEGTFSFNGLGIFPIDALFSSSLSGGSYIDNNWEFPSIGGSLYGYLHVLKADLLKDNGIDPEELVEGFIDNLDGPLAFYNILGLKCLPLRLQMDMNRKEGTITAWKVGTV